MLPTSSTRSLGMEERLCADAVQQRGYIPPCFLQCKMSCWELIPYEVFSSRFTGLSAGVTYVYLVLTRPSGRCRFSACVVRFLGENTKYHGEALPLCSPGKGARAIALERVPSEAHEHCAAGPVHFQTLTPERRRPMALVACYRAFWVTSQGDRVLPQRAQHMPSRSQTGELPLQDEGRPGSHVLFLYSAASVTLSKRYARHPAVTSLGVGIHSSQALSTWMACRTFSLPASNPLHVDVAVDHSTYRAVEILNTCT